MRVVAASFEVGEVVFVRRQKSLRLQSGWDGGCRIAALLRTIALVLA
jgi:hypothetical protein